jgi:2-keto-3-deoxy-L-fuconate dehydrogenase
MFSLENKTAVITGGGSGIGKSISKMFATQGAIVHVLELNETAARETVSEIQLGGGRAFAHLCDVSNHSDTLEVFSAIERIDILVNNAGIAHVGNLLNTNEADFDRLFRVNVKGVYNCLYAAIPLMKLGDSGVILNMSSVAAHVGIPDRFGYSMTKGAIHAITMSVAKDYLNDNIRCNSISPARVHTPFVDGFINKNYPGNEVEIFQKLEQSQPMGRMGRPDEVGALALYLCSDEAAFITGCDYPIDGGFIHLNT